MLRTADTRSIYTCFAGGYVIAWPVALSATSTLAMRRDPEHNVATSERVAADLFGRKNQPTGT